MGTKSNQNKLEFEGKTLKSNSYGEFKVIEYKSTNEVLIKFLSTGAEYTVSLGNIKKGAVKDLMYPSVYGVGYFGIGNYVSRENKGPQNTCYKRWKEMLNRCYNISSKEYNNYGGSGVKVCDEWLNYQNYAKWWEDNCPNENFALDKDILHKGNKLYSPDTCCFVPKDINTVLTLRKSKRGDYPLGVRIKDGNIISQINYMGKKIHLGTFDTVEEAFSKYKEAKEKCIKEYANLHKNEITEKVYNSLLNYKIEITD